MLKGLIWFYPEILDFSSTYGKLVKFDVGLYYEM